MSIEYSNPSSLPSSPVARGTLGVVAPVADPSLLATRLPSHGLGKPALEISLASRINTAFYHNAIPILNEVKIINPHAHDLTDIAITISCPELVRDKTWHIAKIAATSDYSLRDLDIPLNGRFLDGLEENQRAEITFTCHASGQLVAQEYRQVQVLARNEWCGIQGFPEIIAAYVKPNDIAIDKILHHTAQILRDSGKPGIDGYQSGERSRVWEIAAAIWVAIGSLKIEYSNPPASFEQTGQKIRSPSMLYQNETRIGTCLDLTLLYTACLEQAGLNPLVIFKRGHAFTGLWLAKEDFTLAAVDDPQSLRKRLQLQEMVLIETTLLTHQPLPLFRQACEQGAAHIALSEDKDFEVAIDIRRARLRRIFPLADGTKVDPPNPESNSEAPAPLRIEDAPFLPRDVSTPPVMDEEKQPLSRIEKWKRQLLDLSLRNKLLNFRSSENSIIFDCPNPGKLEDLLASGVELKILPHTGLMEGNQDPRSARLHLERNKEDIVKKHTEDALHKRHELYVELDKSKLDRQLRGLSKTVKTAMQEGGANTLYLAIGFLTWQETDAPFQKTETPRRHKAPLILIPVSLVRKNITSDFCLVLHEDEPRLNPTLLQMLRQDFGITIPGLDGELPKDASGLDVGRIWNTMAEAVKNTPGWEVTEEVVLSTFSFTKYLMWKDLVERGDLLRDSLLVRHLLDSSESAFGNSEDFPDVRSLDRHINPGELFCPLPADSTQLAAVAASTKGKSFVLIGPPGTGKSQTITNIIAHALGTGRSVLFVSEKMAALNVVYRRLKDLGLHDFCLELHSSKARKPDVLKQLENSSTAREEFSPDDWQRQANQLKTLRDRLNGYATSLHQKHSNGLTIHRALSHVINAAKAVPFVPLQWAHKDIHTEDGLDQLHQATERLATNLGTLGDIRQHPFVDIKQSKWSPKWQAEFITACRQAISAVSSLQKSWAEVSTSMGLDLRPTAARDFTALARLFAALSSMGQRPIAFGFTADANRTIQEITEALVLVEHIQRIRQRLTGRYAKTATKLPLTQLSRDWKTSLATWWPRKTMIRRRVEKTLAVVVEGEAPKDYGFDLKVLRKIRELEKRLEPYGANLKKALGSFWMDDETDINSIQAVLTWVTQVKSLAADAISVTHVKSFYDTLLILAQDPGRVAPQSSLGQQFHRFSQDLDQILRTTTTMESLVSEKLVVAPGEDWLAQIQAACEAWLAHIPKLNAWCGWQSARQDAEALGLSELVVALERGEVSPEQLSETFMVNYCRWWLDHAVDGDPDLRSFVSAEHEKRIIDFQAADQRLTDLTRKIIRARLCGTLPSPEEKLSNTQWKLLSHEFAKKKMHKPVRQLMTAAPAMIARLAPCMLMSPLSVAQYLPADAKPFDLVIFDEASQIPVWDAVGAIARGKQAIIVGDNKQMPPTNFFSRSSNDSYDEEIGEPEDLESILDQCLSAGVPQLSLRWHYRSQHESLIAFSNRYYYGGGLVTFPSPVTTDSAVSYVHVPDGVYERGSKNPVNQVEAKAVAKAAVEILRENNAMRKPATLGIVTFNKFQQELIEDLISNERRKHPEIESYFSEDLPEPVFVKNLENVQGDERDIILFSICYGPDQNGRLPTTFGPLNLTGGERRLNVAITRARSALKIFTAIHPDQIDLSRTGAQGVRDLKHFLDFAVRGKAALLEATTFTGRAMDSPFEEAVAAELGRRGWQFHPQVGVSGFRVDLGIVHPDKPGRYLAGVECDGATYHRAATARDRDRLREQILTGLGWKILRIWSTDWWVDKEAAANKIHARLTALYQQDLAAIATANASEMSTIAP